MLKKVKYKYNFDVTLGSNLFYLQSLYMTRVSDNYWPSLGVRTHYKLKKHTKHNVTHGHPTYIESCQYILNIHEYHDFVLFVKLLCVLTPDDGW